MEGKLIKMETHGFITDKDKLEFRQIVLVHIKRILDISSHELRDTTITKTFANHSETIEHEDTRFSYIQAVENLAYILVPYFDKKIKTIYYISIKIINDYGFKIKEKFNKELEELKKEYNQAQIPDYFVVEMRLRYAKKLFRELNLLLKRNDYLKSQVYGEGDELGEEEESSEKEQKSKSKKSTKK